MRTDVTVRVMMLVALMVGTAGCGATGDAARPGDAAYARGDWAQALAQYRQLAARQPDAGVLARLGAAALHVGELRQAADAYGRLAGEDATRAHEAIEGLESVARAAERAGNLDVLREVLTTLEGMAPERPIGRYALLLVRRPGIEPAEAATLLPHALAAAGNPALVDSLLTRYGQALEPTAGCGRALLYYRAVLRRSHDGPVREPAGRGVAECAYAMGLRADSEGSVADAALWFAESARVDSTTMTGRRALLRYALARLAQGDTLAAALAFQAVVTAGAADSAGQAAVNRLASLGFSSAGDQ